jgi:GNAT superfamily N-acetyltransferase
MTSADVDQIVAAFLADGWGDRRANLDFAIGHPLSYPVAADADGVVVGTSLVTLNGATGWIGTVWVDPAWRRRGLGRALTQATIDAGEAAGTRSFLFGATDEGRPLYEGLGFEVQTWYQMFEAPGLDDAIPDPRIRPFDPADLPAIEALDQAVTGEERAHLHRAFADPATARVLVRDDGSLGGFVVRAPWGGGATIAPRIDDAEPLLHARRIASGPDRVVRAGLLDENEVGRERLLRADWTESWRAPRLVRGDPPAWQPTAIWGQFNLAMG